MSRSSRIFWIALGTVAVIVLGGGMLLAATGIETGWTTVRVHEKEDGVRIYIPLPGPMVDGGLRLAGAFAPQWRQRCHQGAAVTAELERWGPFIRAAAEALAEGPDGVFVEVESRAETVRIAKRRGKLVVEVTAPDADVEVTVPAGLLPRAVQVAGL